MSSKDVENPLPRTEKNPLVEARRHATQASQNLWPLFLKGLCYIAAIAIFCVPVYLPWQMNCPIIKKDGPYVKDIRCTEDSVVSCNDPCDDSMVACSSLIAVQESGAEDYRGVLPCCTTTSPALCGSSYNITGSLTCTKTIWDMKIRVQYKYFWYSNKYTVYASEFEHPNTRIDKWQKKDKVKCGLHELDPIWVAVVMGFWVLIMFLFCAKLAEAWGLP